MLDANHQIDRRGFFGAVGGLAAVAALGRPAQAQPEKKRALRVAHLTDVHVQPELRAGDGFAACLKHVQDHAQPDLILFGGDHVMDAFQQTRARTQTQWDMFAKILKGGNSVPTKACIGNHDIWGWNKAKSEATGAEPDYGKKWACDALGLAKPYYSFAQAGWHFIALDGVQPGAKPGSYAAYLDAAQKEWLAKELAAVPATTPVLVWSHIPVVSAMPLLARRQEPTSGLTVAAGSCHTDAGDIVRLLAGHPNVKACLSGHLHLIDKVAVRGVDFLCNGAVSGAWWKGPNAGFAEGYAVVDLYSDGTYECKYHPYGWQAAKREKN